jgi:hypothetical protein
MRTAVRIRLSTMMADFTREDLELMMSKLKTDLVAELKPLKLELARNTNVVSSLVEDVSRARIKNLLGVNFVPQYLAGDIPDLLHFVNKVEPANEELREKFIASTVGLVETNLVDFVSDLLTACNFTLDSALLVDGKISDNIFQILDSFKSHLALKRNVYRHEIRVVDKLSWYFRNRNTGKLSRFLLTSDQGPGLPVLIWAVGKKFHESWFQSDLEFDCEGQIFTSVTRMHPRDKTNCIISCGEIKTTLTQKAKKKSKQQLGIRLNVIKTVLQHFFSFDSFTLRGYTFFLNKGGLINELQTDGSSHLEQSIELMLVSLLKFDKANVDEEEFVIDDSDPLG